MPLPMPLPRFRRRRSAVGGRQTAESLQGQGGGGLVGCEAPASARWSRASGPSPPAALPRGTGRPLVSKGTAAGCSESGAAQQPRLLERPDSRRSAIETPEEDSAKAPENPRAIPRASEDGHPELSKQLP